MKPQKLKKLLAVLPFVLLVTSGCNVTKKSLQTSEQATATEQRSSTGSRSDSLTTAAAEQRIETVDSTTRTILLIAEHTYRRRAASAANTESSLHRQADSTAIVRDSVALRQERSAVAVKKRPAGRWLLPVLAIAALLLFLFRSKLKGIKNSLIGFLK